MFKLKINKRKKDVKIFYSNIEMVLSKNVEKMVLKKKQKR